MRTLSVLLFFISTSISQSICAELTTLAPDFKTARAEFDAYKNDISNENQTLRSNFNDFNSTGIPVLALHNGPTRGAPTFEPLDKVYSIGYPVDDGELFILGSGVALDLTAEELAEATQKEIESLVQSSFEPIDGGADLNIIRYNVPYILRLFFYKYEDKRCAEPAYLEQIASQLRPIGGRLE